MSGGKSGNYEQLLDIEPMQDPASQLEFQDFVLSSAEADLIAGKTPTGSSKGRPESVQSPSGYMNKPTTPSRPTSTLASSYQPQQTSPQSAPAPEPGSGAFWNVSYWSQYFQVDTNDVLERIKLTLLPQGKFLETIGNNPDLYGPFWIPTTVIYLVFTAYAITTAMNTNQPNRKLMDITYLSTGTAIVYGYTYGIALLQWGILKYFHSSSTKLFDMFNLYGYGMFIWIPVSLLCLIQISFVKWIVVALGCTISSFFLVRELRLLGGSTSHPAQATSILVIMTFLCQAGLSFLLKFYFFY